MFYKINLLILTIFISFISVNCKTITANIIQHLEWSTHLINGQFPDSIYTCDFKYDNQAKTWTYNESLKIYKNLTITKIFIKKDSLLQDSLIGNTSNMAIPNFKPIIDDTLNMIFRAKINPTSFWDPRYTPRNTYIESYSVNNRSIIVFRIENAIYNGLLYNTTVQLKVLNSSLQTIKRYAVTPQTVMIDTPFISMIPISVKHISTKFIKLNQQPNQIFNILGQLSRNINTHNKQFLNVYYISNKNYYLRQQK